MFVRVLSSTPSHTKDHLPGCVRHHRFGAQRGKHTCVRTASYCLSECVVGIVEVWLDNLRVTLQGFNKQGNTV